MRNKIPVFQIYMGIDRGKKGNDAENIFDHCQFFHPVNSGSGSHFFRKSVSGIKRHRPVCGYESMDISDSGDAGDAGGRLTIRNGVLSRFVGDFRSGSRRKFVQLIQSLTFSKKGVDK